MEMEPRLSIVALFNGVLVFTLVQSLFLGRISAFPESRASPVVEDPDTDTDTDTDESVSKTTLAAWNQWNDHSCTLSCHDATQCDSTCGRGNMTRTRTCSTGVNSDCEAAGETWWSVAACNISCAVAWTQWTTNGHCSSTCGGGYQQRTRNCTTGNMNDCRYLAGKWWEVIVCTYGPCSHWLEWSSWSVCTSTCGSGFTSRLRTCSTGNNNNCTGKHFDVDQCNVTCPETGTASTPSTTKATTTLTTMTTNSIECSPLSSPNNGTVEISGVSPGSMATFTCGSGFTQVGASRTFCLTDGRWSDLSPICVIGCEHLKKPVYGDVTTTGQVPGSVATFACLDSYTLDGPTRLYCLATGRWSDRSPTCRPNTRITAIPGCPSLLPPRHGYVNPYNTTSGSFAHTQCLSGYVLQGSEIRICGENGQWSGTEPTCQLRSII